MPIISRETTESRRIVVLVRTRCEALDPLKKQLINVVGVHIMPKRTEMKIRTSIVGTASDFLGIFQEFVGKLDKS